MSFQLCLHRRVEATAVRIPLHGVPAQHNSGTQLPSDTPVKHGKAIVSNGLKILKGHEDA